MRWRILAVSLVLLGALAVAWRLTAPRAEGTSGGAMTVDCDAGAPGIQDDCSYPSGATFSTQVHVTKAPPGGSFAFQTKLRWSDAQLDYLPAADAADESLWAHCDIAARADNQPLDPSLVYGCVSFPLLASGDTTVGAVLQFEFQCQADGNTPLELVAREGDSQGGAQFLDEVGQQIDPELMSAHVLCGTKPPTPTPCAPNGCPTPTPIPAPALALDAACSPDAIRPDETALVTCSAIITNSGDAVASSPDLVVGSLAEGLLWIVFSPFDLTLDGQAVAVSRYQSRLPLPDLMPGQTVEARGRFIVPARQSEGAYDTMMSLVLNEETVDSAVLRIDVDVDAVHPPANLAISKSILTELDDPLAVPETVEYEFVVANVSDVMINNVAVLDKYSESVVPVATDPLAANVNETTHIITWEVGSLAPGEEVRVRATFGPLFECSIAFNDMVVTAQSDDGLEEYATRSPDFVAISASGPDACLFFGGGDGPLSAAPDDSSGGDESSEGPGETGSDTAASQPNASLNEPPGPGEHPARGSASVAWSDEASRVAGGQTAAQPVVLPQTGVRDVTRDRFPWQSFVVALAAGGMLTLSLGVLGLRHRVS